jgi:hypothetical protein
VVEAGDAIEEHVKVIVKESMEAALERIIPEVPFAVEPKIANSWKVAPAHRLSGIGIHWPTGPFSYLFI